MKRKSWKLVTQAVAVLVSVSTALNSVPVLAQAEENDTYSQVENEYGPAEGWEIRNGNHNCRILNENVLEIDTEIGDFAKGYSEPKNYWLFDAPAGDFSFTVKVSGGLNAHAQKAGLMVFKDSQTIVSVSRRFHKNMKWNNVFGMFQNLDGQWGENSLLDERKNVPAYLKLERSGALFKGFYRYENQSEWTYVGELHNEPVGTTGNMKIGVYAVNGSTNDGVKVTFEDFECNGTKIPFGSSTNGIATFDMDVDIPKYMLLGDDENITVRATDQNGEIVDLTNTTIGFSSDHEDIVSVEENGVIRAKMPGTAVITITMKLDGLTKEERYTVKVDGEEDMIWPITSPSGTDTIIFALNDSGTVEYVKQKNSNVIEQGTAGLVTDIGDFTSGLIFDSESELTNVVDEYDLIGAKISHVSASGNCKFLRFHDDDGTLFEIEARAYDDGTAFRYIVDDIDQKSISIEREDTIGVIPSDSTIYAMEYAANHQKEVKQYDDPALLNGDYQVPVLYQTDDDVWGLISEADVQGTYCGSYITSTGHGDLKYTFSKQQSGPVHTSLPFTSPWRYSVAGTPSDIAVNTMAETLSPASSGDWSWVEPGICSWTWLNGDSTSDFDTYKRYVDMTTEMGWQYVLLDAGWQPSFGEYYDWFPEFLAYARSKNIRPIVWVESSDVKESEVRRKTFEEWREMGIAGVKIDHFNNDSQEYMKLYDDIMVDAKNSHLLVNLHGCPQPHGERRTFPMMLTREGLLGGESASSLSAFHNCMLPFTRLAVGPADFTPMFSAYGNAKFSVGQMAAMAVIYESGIQCLADKPVNYVDAPSEYFFKDLPSEYDELRILDADPGHLVSMAKRHGDDWYAGVMCNEKQDAVIDLSFLGDGKYYAFIVKDGKTSDTVNTEWRTVSKTEQLKIPMLEAGGVAIRITRDRPTVPERIELNEHEMTLEEGHIGQLKAITEPEYVDMNVLTWASDNESVARVDNGKIDAVGTGTAVITVSTGFDNELVDKCTVHVVKPKYVLNDRWQIVNEDKEHWSIDNAGNIHIDSQPGQIYINSYNMHNLFLTPIENRDFTADVKLDFKPFANHQTAGLILFDSSIDNFTVSRRFHTGLGGKVVGYQGLNNSSDSFVEKKITDPSSSQDPIYLRIKRDGEILSAYYSFDRTDWTQIDENIAYPALSGAKNLKIGLYVSNGRQQPSTPALFSDLVITYKGEDPQSIPMTDRTEESTPEMVSLTFSFKGKTTIKQVEKGSALKDQFPDVLLENDEVLKEWNTQADGKGEKVNAETIADKNMTIYAIIGHTSPMATLKPSKPVLLPTTVPSPAPTAKPTEKPNSSDKNENTNNDKRPATGDTRSAMPWAFVLVGAIVACFIIKKQ